LEAERGVSKGAPGGRNPERLAQASYAQRRHNLSGETLIPAWETLHVREGNLDLHCTQLQQGRLPLDALIRPPYAGVTAG